MIKNKKKKGFTLVELIAVIAILGILAAVIVPKVSNYSDSAKLAKEKANANTILNAIEIYNAQATSVTIDTTSATCSLDNIVTDGTNGTSGSTLSSDDTNVVSDLKATINKVINTGGLINKYSTLQNLSNAIKSTTYSDIKTQLPNNAPKS